MEKSLDAAGNPKLCEIPEAEIIRCRTGNSWAPDNPGGENMRWSMRCEDKMTILVIDGQGGRLGRQLVEAARKQFPDAEILAVGTNATAAAAMLKGGADDVATGENPVVVACRRADIIIGPLGIVIADSLLGEVTERMALAIARSRAERILLPMNRCDNLVAGVNVQNITELIDDAIAKMVEIAADK